MAPRSVRLALLAVAAVLASTVPSVLLPSSVTAVSGSDLIITVAGGGELQEVGLDVPVFVGAYSGDGASAVKARLDKPTALSADDSGNIYMVDQQGLRVRKIDTSGVITTVAGNGSRASTGDGGLAVKAGLLGVKGMAVDGAGNLYMSDGARVRRVDAASGIIATVAGGASGSTADNGDGGPATEAWFSKPWGVALDGAGSLYVADGGDHRVRKVSTGADGMVDGDADETITTYAGTGPVPLTQTGGFSGDGGPASQAMLNGPAGLAADGQGNLYFTVFGRIRRVDTAGIISTVAGTGTQGFSGDGGPATAAEISGSELALDASGGLYLSGGGTINRVRKVAAGADGMVDGDQDDIITTVAGTGQFNNAEQRNAGFAGDDGPAGQAMVARPEGLAVDPVGGLYIADTDNHRVRRVGPDGPLRLTMADSADPVVTNGELIFNLSIETFSDGAATAVALTNSLPEGATLVSVTPEQGTCSHAGATVKCNLGEVRAGAKVKVAIATTAPPEPTRWTNRARVSSAEADPYPQDNIAVETTDVIDPPGLPEIITTVAGRTRTRNIDGVPQGDELNQPKGVAVDGEGALYISDRGSFSNTGVVRKFDSSGHVTRVAGGGSVPGDGGKATEAMLATPSGLALDGFENLYIADPEDNRIRKVDTSGIITTVAGNGIEPKSTIPIGDGGPAKLATLDAINVAFDGAGNLYIADGGNNRIRVVRPGADGEIDGDDLITTLAGNGSAAHSGDGGPATQAGLDPRDLSLDSAGNVYFTDLSHRVRKVDTAGTITTLAGTGAPGFGGDGGPATEAFLTFPNGIGLDPSGNVYIADSNNHRVRKVDTTGTITTIAGTGVRDYSGDGGPAIEAQLQAPTDLAVDSEGGVFFVDNRSWNERIRRVAKDLLILAGSDGPDPVVSGTPFGYTLKILAGGPATGVTLTDTLPPGVSFVSASSNKGSCSHAAGTVTCELGFISADDASRATATTVQIEVYAPTNPGLITNRATVVANEADPYARSNTAGNTTTVVAPSGTGMGLGVFDTPDPVVAGKPLKYLLSVANHLGVPATEVTLSDPLPGGVLFDSASASQGTCTASGQVVTCALGELAPEAVATATIAVVPQASGVVSNTATVVAKEFPTGTSTTATTNVSAANCGLVITEDTVLQGDVGPCDSTGIVVGADGVTLDLGGHRVYGTPGASDPALNGGVLGNQAGIYLPGRTNVTVKNGTVSDFDAGVFLRGGSSNTITGLMVRDNIGPAGSNDAELGDGIVLFDSASNSILANSVINNGNYDGIGILGGRSDNNVIRDNIVEATVAVPEDPLANPGWANHGQGIMINASSIGNPGGQVISNTEVVGNTVRASAAAGISNVNHVGGVIFDNVIENNGGVNGPANGIGVQTGPGWGGGSVNLVIQSNQIHANKASGIHVLGGVSGARVLNNDVGNNNTLNDAKYKDLLDSNSECAGNFWAGNTAGTGGFSPACTAAPDTNGPNTHIVSGPTGPTTDNTPTFEFSSPEPASTFTCRLDAAAFAPCTSPHTTAPLTPGPHSFEVAATDPAGNVDSSPAVVSFTVGTTTAAVSAVADFNGDGATDISVFRAGSGSWFPQGGAADAWGTEGDIAVPGDYDGAAGAEMAVFRPSTGTWFVKGGAITAWGTEGDLPVPGDYDGDKKADVAVFRPSTGAWYVRPSGGGPEQSLGWGTTGDIPVPGDYNGDGTTEIAVFRPSSGTWFVQGGPTIAWGTEGDIPVPGDYDADGSTDMAVFRPASGTWFVEGGPTVAWGTAGDIPVPGDYHGNDAADMAVFRPSSGTWFVNGGATTNWGTAGDQPLPLPPAIRQSL